MSNANKAADDLKSFAKKMLPIFEVAKCLEEIGSLDNAASEAKARKDAAYKEADQALASMEKQKAKLLDAEQLVAAAYKQADEIVVSAKAIAAKLAADAKVKADEVLGEVEAQLENLKSEAKVLKSEIRALEAEKSAAQGNLAAIRLQLSETKDKVMSLSNG